MKISKLKLLFFALVAITSLLLILLYINKYLYRTKASAPTPTITWDPMSNPQYELDTLFKPDFSSVQTINAGGGWLVGNAPLSQQQVSGNFEFGPGKFGPAVRGKTGSTINYVFYPIDGLIPGDEWTIQFFAKSDYAWSSGSGRIFGLVGNETNELNIELSGGQLVVTTSLYNTSPQFGGGFHRTWQASTDSLGLNANTWQAIGLTYKNKTLSIFVNGNLAGTITNVDWKPLWSDDTRSTGIEIGGRPTSNIWVSDLAIYRTARIPNKETPLHSMEGAITIDVNSNAGTVPAKLLGALHPLPLNVPSSQIQAALQTVRTDKFLTVTPMKRGDSDADHPNPGHSGQFSYDWQVVDRTLNWMSDHGVTPYLSVDSTPQLLGGNVPPYVHGGNSGNNLDSDLSGTSSFSSVPPNNMNDWNTVVQDLIYHILREKNTTVTHWGVWNEPDITDFWLGTRQQYLDLYASTVRAIRAIEPSAKVGGPEISSLNNQDWIRDLFVRAKQDNLPLDFIAYHDYSGDLTNLDMTRRLVDFYATQNGYPTPFPVLQTEFNWQSENLYIPGSNYRYQTDFWSMKSLGAAYTTASLIHMLELPQMPLQIYSHVSYGNPRTGGFNGDQLLGPNNEQWASYNALKGFKQTIGSQILSSTKDLPPGVFALSSKNSATGKVGIVLANWGPAQRQSRKVNITLNNLSNGTYHLKRSLVDQAHSSRWDLAEDRPEGASQNDLQIVEDQNINVSGTTNLSVDLPQWSSTFITLEPGAGVIQPTSSTPIATPTPTPTVLAPTPTSATQVPTPTPTLPPIQGGSSAGPANLTLTLNSPTTVELSWAPWIPSSGASVFEYSIERNGATIKSVKTNNYTDSGLTQGQSYTYVISASDTNGTYSQSSNRASITIGAVSTIPPTPTIAPNSTSLALNLLLHGLGKGGDSSNPGSGGNANPKRVQRIVKVELFNSQNQLALTKEGNVSFDSTSGSFKGSVDLGTTFPTGVYSVKVKSDQYLKTLVPGIQSLTQGRTNPLPATTLTSGDVNNDNRIDILDYNIFIDCYSDLTPAKNCSDSAKKQSADITDDGAVNQFDYNLFLRELTNIRGE